jgi:hypothetical protein
MMTWRHSRALRKCGTSSSNTDLGSRFASGVRQRIHAGRRWSSWDVQTKNSFRDVVCRRGGGFLPVSVWTGRVRCRSAGRVRSSDESQFGHVEWQTPYVAGVPQ